MEIDFSSPPTLTLAAVGALATLLLISYTVNLILERASRKNSARTRELVAAAVEGLVICKDGAIVNFNARALKLCGRTAAELLGKDVFGSLLAASRRPASSAQDQYLFEVPLLHADGTTIPVEVVFEHVAGLAEGDEVYAIRDLREREEAGRQLTQANEELRRREQDLRVRNLILDGALESMSQGLCVYDHDHRIIINNKRYSAIYGVPADAIRPGMSLQEVVQLRIDNGVFAGKSPAAYMQERTAPFRTPQDTVHELSNGRVIAISRRPIPGGGWVTTHEDITEKRQMEKQVEDLLHRDPLTGLSRRSALRDRLQETIISAKKNDNRLVVLVLGIDRFGQINDTLGHATGDSLLKAVADRLQKALRRATVLARFGDDTFALVEIVDHPARDATGLAKRLQEEIRKPFVFGDNMLDVTATMGIANFPADGTDADILLKNAAIALNRGRLEARGRHYFFEAGMDEELRSKRALQLELGVAVEEQQFELHYLPMVDLKRNQIAGLEALLRWRHPTKGLMLPGSFLDAVEEAGLITALGDWTLQQACRHAVRWPKHIIVSVNISVDQFWSGNLVSSITKALSASGLEAHRLEIEITEKVIHADANEALKILQRISVLGVLIALDDFGSGFTSLTYMRQFPVNKIKIDRGFVAGLSEREDSRIVIRTLARLGAGLGLVTTAEGVETKDQLDAVLAEGCTEMQGYYFSKPKTTDEIENLLLTTKATGKAVA